MFIYFAHPIDQANKHPAMDQLRKTITIVEDSADAEGHTLFWPGKAYRLGYDNLGLPNPNDHGILDSINRYALSQADALVAVLIDLIPTLGVPAEIEQALALNKPVLILTSAHLSVHSVQVSQWAARGAAVHIFIPGEVEMLRLTEWLSWLPRPKDACLARELLNVSSFTGPATIEGVTVEPDIDLLVRYDTAAKPLRRAYPTDAGFDLATLEGVRLERGVRTKLRTGVHAPPPDGWWGLIKARSSTAPKYQIEVHEAVIDAGYQGELIIAVTLVHTGLSFFNLGPGTRLAQYILIPSFPGKLRPVAEFAPSHRGTNGYGSSGA